MGIKPASLHWKLERWLISCCSVFCREKGLDLNLVWRLSLGEREGAELRGLGKLWIFLEQGWKGERQRES